MHIIEPCSGIFRLTRHYAEWKSRLQSRFRPDMRQGLGVVRDTLPDKK